MTLIPTTERTQYCFVDCGKEICECKPSKNIEMNKELTAIQMLYELIGSEVERLSKVKGEHKKASEQCANQLVILKMKVNDMNLLQKEQEQIEQAFDAGVQSGMTKGYQNVGKDYYQSKYGGENEIINN